MKGLLSDGCKKQGQPDSKLTITNRKPTVLQSLFYIFVLLKELMRHHLLVVACSTDLTKLALLKYQKTKKTTRSNLRP